ncbi:MAG TPA: CPBP family intramembrane metalloprotease [Planctomycetes bacterium]|nr:CPBP family intramembrane metalloprotease [Planctomycetota bacterium]
MDAAPAGHREGRPSIVLLEYFTETRRPVYTFFLVLPFVLLYEAGMIFLSLSAREWDVRNGADAILRALFFPSKLADAGTWGTVIWTLFSALILFGAFGWWQLRSAASWKLKPRHLWYCYLESFAWGIILLLLVIPLKMLGLPEGMSMAPPCSQGGQAEFGLLERIVMSAGAGVYEELVFRLFLAGGLILMLRGMLGVHRAGAAIAAVVLASLVFSGVHYIGDYGDSFTWASFVFRVVAGVFFSLLFHYRSFGVAVATHAFYDIIVNLLISAAGYARS